MRRVEFRIEADAHFQRFVDWRAQCLERDERLEAMDDALVPDEFAEHVQRYRFARASAIVDNEPNPEGAGVAAVHAWLRARYSERADEKLAAWRGAFRASICRPNTANAEQRAVLLRKGLQIGGSTNGNAFNPERA